MNTEYIYLDGKAIIRDESNNYTLLDYYENLNKVLVEENNIETLEAEIKKLTDEKEKYKNKKIFYPKYYIIIGGVGISVTLLLWALSGTNPFTTSISNTPFGEMNLALYLAISTTGTSLVFSTLFSVVDFLNHKEDLKKIDGIDYQLQKLEIDLEKSKNNLVELKKDHIQTKKEKNAFKVEKIDLEQLKSIKRLLKIYDNLGQNGEKYYKYYQNNKLEDKLKKEYTEEEINLAKEYIEEKGPSLIKKRNKKTNNLK